MSDAIEDDDLARIPQVGEIVASKYRVESVIGSGGMGVVMRATHVHLGEPVALKFLRFAASESDALVERFLREARAAVRIRSEHVARVFDVGTLPTGSPYMVMELLEGEDLNRVGKKRGPLPASEALEYILQACRALGEAHHLGIIHRDLKPANLFLTHRSDGSPLVKVLDFGISKVLDGSDQTLTTTADVLGSPLYMSPEQIRDARKVDGRSDIWALGNILYRLLVGRAPFTADSSAATLARIITEDPAPVRRARPDVPEEVEQLVSRCLEKAPEKRFQQVEALAAAITASLASLQRPSAAPIQDPASSQRPGAAMRLGGSQLGSPIRTVPISEPRTGPTTAWNVATGQSQASWIDSSESISSSGVTVHATGVTSATAVTPSSEPTRLLTLGESSRASAAPPRFQPMPSRGPSVRPNDDVRSTTQLDPKKLAGSPHFSANARSLPPADRAPRTEAPWHPAPPATASQGRAAAPVLFDPSDNVTTKIRPVPAVETRIFGLAVSRRAMTVGIVASISVGALLALAALHSRHGDDPPVPASSASSAPSGSASATTPPKPAH